MPSKLIRVGLRRHLGSFQTIQVKNWSGAEVLENKEHDSCVPAHGILSQE